MSQPAAGNDDREVLYLDYAATTPCDPRVLDAMLPWMGELAANPHQVAHAAGRRAKAAMEDARCDVARLFSPDAHCAEVAFTSGATEANNLAILGLTGIGSRRRAIVVSALEHASVLVPGVEATSRGFELRICPATADGVIDLDALADLVDEDTLVVSVMGANNELGTIQPVREAAAIAHAAGAWMHCDMAQAAGRFAAADVLGLDVDIATMSGHKLYAPMGVGAIWVRTGADPGSLAPQVHGGGQERGLRSGTANLPGIVGLGVAARLAREDMAAEHARVTRLRERLEQGLVASIDGVRINGANAPRVPGTLSVTLPAGTTREVLSAVPELAASPTSACSAGSAKVSRVLASIGLSEREANRTMRLSVGRFTTDEDIDRAVDGIARAAARPAGARPTPQAAAAARRTSVVATTPAP